MILTFFNRKCLFAAFNVAALMLAVFVLPIPKAFAQSTSTKNAFVAADVENQSGIITIYLANTSPKELLTYPGFSYITVQVGNDYYTNNPNGATDVEPSGTLVTPIYLTSSGSTKLVPGTDTIRTIWQPKGPNAFDIIQDVYPVAGATSGQIVYKWSIVNHQSTFINAQLQYLMDIETSHNGSPPAPAYGTDIPAVTTRDGYNVDTWQDITNVPYFITTEYRTCDRNFPGIMGAGFINDSLAPVPMNLMPPTDVAIVDWHIIAPQYLWGYPAGQLGSIMGDDDNAILLQWPASGAGQNVEQEIGRGSYGTPPCTMAYGNLDALILHVDNHIVWAPSLTYVPNHFPVEAIIWNANSGSTGVAATATQTIKNTFTGLPSGPVKIVSPSPIGTNGYSQTHAIRSCGSTHFDSVINVCNASYATWEDTVVQNVLTNCSTDSSYDITVSVAAQGIQNLFIAGPPVCPVIVDCQEKDVLAPRHSAPKIIPGDTTHCGYPKAYKIDSVFDDLVTDQGIQSITYTVAPNAGSIVVTGLPATISGCPPKVGPITITQMDTLHDACITFTFTDCAGNTSDTTICFEKCLPLVPFDNIPPKFRLLNKSDWNNPTDSACGNKCSTWMVTDTVFNGLQQDAGLDSLKPIADTNMTFTLLGQPLRRGMPRDSFTVCVADSMQDGFIIIQANDAANPENISFDTITYCTVADTKAPFVNIGSPTGYQVPVQVTETRPWDRGIKQVRVVSVSHPAGIDYCTPIPGSGPMTIDTINDSTWLILPDTNCPEELDFKVAIADSFHTACFTVQATDCAGNTSTPPQQYCSTALSDKDCVKIDTTTIAPGVLSVTISDNTESFDEGIDSIWFTCANNITLDSAGSSDSSAIWFSRNNALHALHGKPTGGDHPTYQQVIRFTLSVTDTNAQNGEPCVCINAINGAGNLLCSPGMIQWCSSLNQDTAPPKLNTATTCASLDAVVTDSQLYDRGVYHVWLDSLTNFAPLDDSFPSGEPSVPLTLRIPEPDSSSYAQLNALDLYGEQSPVPSVKAAHTTASDIWVYKQDLAMNGSGIDTTRMFYVPVYLTSTDAVPLSQKNLTQFQFTFHLSGSPLVSFVGTKLSPSLAGWTIIPPPGTIPLGPPYTISGSGPALANILDTLVYLQFSAGVSPDVEEAQIVIDQDSCGADVFYNGGNDTTLSAKHYSITLPAPSGRLNGGTIILKDSCATIVGDHPHPIYLSLAPMAPNPVTSSAIVQYTVPAEAPVTLSLYDELGRNVRTLVAEVQKQGTYNYTLDASGLPQGTYFLRLASGGAVCSRRIMLSRQ